MYSTSYIIASHSSGSPYRVSFLMESIVMVYMEMWYSTIIILCCWYGWTSCSSLQDKLFLLHHTSIFINIYIIFLL